MALFDDALPKCRYNLWHDGVARLFVQLGLGDVGRFGPVKLTIRPSHEPPAFSWRQTADSWLPKENTVFAVHPIPRPDQHAGAHLTGVQPLVVTRIQTRGDIAQRELRVLAATTPCDEHAVRVHGREREHGLVRFLEPSALVLSEKSRGRDGRCDKFLCAFARARFDQGRTGDGRGNLWVACSRMS